MSTILIVWASCSVIILVGFGFGLATDKRLSKIDGIGGAFWGMLILSPIFVPVLIGILIGKIFVKERP